jgi:hypothetical protein
LYPGTDFCKLYFTCLFNFNLSVLTLMTYDTPSLPLPGANRNLICENSVMSNIVWDSSF